MGCLHWSEKEPFLPLKLGAIFARHDVTFALNDMGVGDGNDPQGEQKRWIYLA